jgi:hypothetical protein
MHMRPQSLCLCVRAARAFAAAACARLSHTRHVVCDRHTPRLTIACLICTVCVVRLLLQVLQWAMFVVAVVLSYLLTGFVTRTCAYILTHQLSALLFKG